MGEFFPLTPRSHSIHLSPLGTDFAKDMACSSSPSLIFDHLPVKGGGALMCGGVLVLLEFGHHR